MSFGLIGLKDEFERDAIAGLTQVSQEQERNDQLYEQQKEIRSTQKKQTIGSFAGAGLAAGGPMGAAIGALAGFALTEIF